MSSKGYRAWLRPSRFWRFSSGIFSYSDVCRRWRERRFSVYVTDRGGGEPLRPITATRGELNRLPMFEYVDSRRIVKGRVSSLRPSAAGSPCLRRQWRLLRLADFVRSRAKGRRHRLYSHRQAPTGPRRPPGWTSPPTRPSPSRPQPGSPSRMSETGGGESNMKLAMVAALCASLACARRSSARALRAWRTSPFTLTISDKSREFTPAFWDSRAVFPQKSGWQPSMAFFYDQRPPVRSSLPETQAGADRPVPHRAWRPMTPPRAGVPGLARGQDAGPRPPRAALATPVSTSPTGRPTPSRASCSHEPNGWSMREKGNFMNENRAADHMSHVGVIVASLDPALKFYGDIHGLPGRSGAGSQNGKSFCGGEHESAGGRRLRSVMLYDQYPPGCGNSASFITWPGPQDMAKAAADHGAQPGRKTYRSPGSPIAPIQRQISGVRSRRLAHRADAAGRPEPPIFHRAAHSVAARIRNQETVPQALRFEGSRSARPAWIFLSWL